MFVLVKVQRNCPLLFPDQADRLNHFRWSYSVIGLIQLAALMGALGTGKCLSSTHTQVLSLARLCSDTWKEQNKCTFAYLSSTL